MNDTPKPNPLPDYETEPALRNVTYRPTDKVCTTCGDKHTGPLAQCARCSSRGES